MTTTKFTIICIVCIILNGLNTQASAGQSAQMNCIDNGAEKIKKKDANKCAKYEMHVTITSDEDTGKQGALGIFAISEKSKQVAVWTEEKGWVPYSKNELVKPTESGLKKLDAKREYVVFKGSAESLCQFANGQSFNLYAWHVGLMPDQIYKHKAFMQKYMITGWQAENFMNSILLKESIEQKKGGLIYTNKCPVI